MKHVASCRSLPLLDTRTRAVAKFLAALPKVVMHYPKLLEALAAGPPAEQMRAIVEQTARDPAITLQSETSERPS